jgi:hypothetical protein
MPIVTTVNAEEYVSKSSLNYFQTLLISDGILYNWTDNGFLNIGAPEQYRENKKIFHREEAVSTYNDAATAARNSLGGHLEIFEIGFTVTEQ